MHVTLKKAAALALALSTIAIPVQASIKVGVFDDVPDIDAAQANMISAVDAALKRNAAVFEIRRMIGKANEGRINELLTTRAMIDKQLATLNAIPVVTKVPQLDAIQRELEAMRAAPADPYRKKELVIELETASKFAADIKGIKRARVQIEDELAQLNYSTTIELPEDVVAILTEHDLV